MADDTHDLDRSPTSGNPSVSAGARLAAPLAVAVGLFGVPFAVLARDAGMTPAATLVMSATTFAGSAQFAAAAVLQAGGGAAAAVLAAVLLNSRYLPMGVSVAPDLGGSPLRRLLMAQLVVDESWGVARTRDGVDAGRLLGAGLVLYLAWVAGTAAGLLLAGVLPEPRTLGLDAAFPALFLALLVAGVRNRTDTAVALGGAGLALALTPVLPPGLPLLAAGLAALAVVRR